MYMRKGIVLLLSFIIAGAVAFPVGASAKVTDVPRDTSFTVWSTDVKVRKKHPEVRLMRPLLSPGVKAYENVVYTHLDETPFGPRDLHVDVFRPDNDSIYPALIMVHGGGWNSGDRSLQMPMAQRIARAGYVTIPVEYRLIPEAVYPAGLHDIKTVVRWARKHAADYGIDPDRIAVSGCSAGAQLATLVGVTNGSERHEGSGQWSDVSSDVQAIVSIDGVATFVSPENIADSEEYLKKRGYYHVNAKWLGGIYKESPDNWNEASAVNWVTPASAPVCFINSGLQRYHDGRDELIGLYENRGLYTEVHELGIDVHPFWFFHPWVDETMYYTVRYLDKIFKTPDLTLIVEQYLKI